MDAITQAAIPVVEVGTVTYAAKYLGVHRNTVYNWIKKRKLAALWLNGQYVFLQSELDAARARQAHKRHTTHD